LITTRRPTSARSGIALQEWLDHLSDLGNGGHYLHLGRISLTRMR
jgi:hypothetical protein